MSFMFAEATVLNGDLSAWATISVADASCMFHNAQRFAGNLSMWNVSSVNYTSCMFSDTPECISDVSARDTSNVVESFSMEREQCCAHIFNARPMVQPVQAIIVAKRRSYCSTVKCFDCPHSRV
jgi:Mycoplasma protein of unknown function, DUF285